MRAVLKSSSFIIADITGSVVVLYVSVFWYRIVVGTLLVIMPHMERVHTDDRKCFRKRGQSCSVALEGV